MSEGLQVGEAHAREQLTRLLARADGRHERKRPARLDVEAPTSLAYGAAIAWKEHLEKLAGRGVIKLGRGKRNQRDAIHSIQMVDADRLAVLLGIARAATIAGTTYVAVVDACRDHQELLAVVELAHEKWAIGKSWKGIPPKAETAAADFTVANALLDGAFSQPDERSVALSASGQSKYLARRGGSVAAILRAALELPDELPWRDVLALVGISRFEHPVVLRAPLSGPVPCDAAPWIGLGPQHFQQLVPRETPPYVLTIENWTSFNRHVREVSDSAAVIYTGGFPSPAVRRAIAALARLWPDVPMFHWGDIDAGGLLIAVAVEAAAERSVEPHLMSPDTASVHWRASGPLTRVRGLAQRTDRWGELARFLVGQASRKLEQEAIDPARPSTGAV